MSYLAPGGRFLLALIFLISGISKLASWNDTAAFMSLAGLPMVPVLLAIATAIEIVGGLCVMLGYRTDVTALVMFIYLIPVTLIFHNFWRYQGVEAQLQLVNFLKNLSIMGGLLAVAATSPTPVSIDEARARRHPPAVTPSVA